MIYQVSITEQAEADLRGIYEYIAFEKLSPENAAGQIGRLEKHIMEDDKNFNIVERRIISLEECERYCREEANRMYKSRFWNYIKDSYRIVVCCEMSRVLARLIS